jgi:hypothetical protein
MASENEIYVFVFIKNGSKMDFQWMENGFESLEFIVEDDLPFPLSLSPSAK